MRRYPLPPFLEGVCTYEMYRQWLDRKAAAHVKRDRKSGNAQCSGESYRREIHRAVLASDGRDHYTGEALRWDLISTYDNEESRAGRRAYKATFALLPTVDHADGRSGEASFRICGWRTNDCKNDLTYDELVEFCRVLLAHREMPCESVEPPAAHVVGVNDVARSSAVESPESLLAPQGA
jgi:hypothetical protein